MVLHHGSVHYEDAPDGGARFIVRIPLTASNAVREPEGRRTPKKSAHKAPIGL
jgi:hypothetical protein